VGLSPRDPAARFQKERRPVRIGDKANHPSWGFHYLCSAACPELKEKAGAPLPRRAVGGGVAPGRSDIAVAPHQDGKEPGTRSGGSTDVDVEPGEERDADVNTCTTGERLPRRNAFTPEHQRHVFVRPATTTPSPHREHRGLSPLFPPSWSFL
jgi:hypothetical protein